MTVQTADIPEWSVEFSIRRQRSQRLQIWTWNHVINIWQYIGCVHHSLTTSYHIHTWMSNVSLTVNINTHTHTHTHTHSRCCSLLTLISVQLTFGS